MDIILDQLNGFEWDKGNESKITSRHGVTPLEAEEAFFNFNLTYYDSLHSHTESRYHLLGQTNDGRILFIVFTIRRQKIRVISARAANEKERRIYDQAKKNS